MHFKRQSGTLSSALGTVGGGVALAFPDQRWAGFVLMALGCLVFVFDVRVEHGRLEVGGRRAWLGQQRAKLDPYLLVAALAAAICVAALIGYARRGPSGPIAWSLISENSPFSASMRYGGPLWIDGFQVNGENISGRPIEPKEISVQSDLTLQKLDLEALKGGQTIPLDKTILLPEGNFSFFYGLPSSDPSRSRGMSIEEFRSKFGAFTFRFKSDGYYFERPFSRTEVNKNLERMTEFYKNLLEKNMRNVVGGPSGVGEKP